MLLYFSKYVGYLYFWVFSLKKKSYLTDLKDLRLSVIF